MSEELTGYISHIIYRKPENNYTVFEFANGPDDIVCTGFLHGVDEGEDLIIRGEYVNHQVYGEQFRVDSYETKAPDDEESMIRYLGSGAIKGVGPSLAKKIVDRFKDDTFRIFEEEPERLSEIKGISEKKARDIAVLFMEKREMRRVLIYLQQYGITNNMALKIYKRYDLETYRIISQNPYRLVEDIEGIGFKTADSIAARTGIRKNSEQRIRSGIVYTLNRGIQDGNVYLPKDELIKNCAAILEVDEDEIWTHVMNLSMDKKLVIRSWDDTTAVYIGRYYYMELMAARKLRDLDITCFEDGSGVERRLSRIEKDLKIELETIQREAVKKAVMNGLTVITGGPGTGKTTIIKAIIRYFEDEDMSIVLAAPTGRAAKRMSEVTGYEAGTIQRLLHLRPASESGNDNSGYYYEKNEDDPIEADVVIIDEMSMVDIALFTALLKATLPGTRLIMVGDSDQLPSVGPGSVLKDLIDSGCFECVRLNRIFRQEEQSDIVINAHRINAGLDIKLDNKSKDFFFLERDDINPILKNIVLLIRDKLPGFLGEDSLDIQVLTPMRKGMLGVESLNPILQKYLNPPDENKKEKEYGDTVFREGDKVMQIKNDYQLTWVIRSKYGIEIDKGEGIFNGDTGTIVSIEDRFERLSVEYDGGRMVEYGFGNLDELELAYAITIHKSQGSQYPAIIMPVLNGPKLLFNRNLLYTGVTRASKCVVMIGSRKQIEHMIENVDETKRYTGLKERIKEIYSYDP
ncbi:MAG: ATP-dependent RecD-like DNA helicase [Lachnospiraceae bacterium]|nr:ATP-dependent RecD-like DNA helicase [Lachnospiraceae bacterium]